MPWVHKTFVPHLPEVALDEYLKLRFDNDEEVIDNSQYKTISIAAILKTHVGCALAGMALVDKQFILGQ